MSLILQNVIASLLYAYRAYVMLFRKGTYRMQRTIATWYYATMNEFYVHDQLKYTVIFIASFTIGELHQTTDSHVIVIP